MRVCLRVFLLVVCVGSLVSPAFAQQVSGGVIGGAVFTDLPSFADVTGDPTIETGMRTGFLLGGFASFPVTPRLSIQPEVLYHQKGLEFAGATGGPVPDADATVQLDYLEVPVLAVYRFAESRRTGYVLGGVAFGFNTRARVTVAGGGSDDEVDVDEDVKDSEFSLVFGGGVALGKFLIEARWTEGLTGVNEESFAVSDVRNRSIAVLAGVRF